MFNRSCSMVVLALLASGAQADTVLREIAVSGAQGDPLKGIADSASEGVVNARDLEKRPLLRPAEVMETIPGMIVTQHSGDGKANQYFLRGFNLDHGTDFSTRVLGMPVNLVSHAHGQGYMDLNFLIPELIGQINYRKGAYSAEDGDFATAGSARIDYLRTLAAPFAEATLGQHNYRRLVSAGSYRLGEGNLLAAMELAGNDGPWEQAENLRKSNVVLRYAAGTVQNGYALTFMNYQSRWKATEHVPERAIESGEIGRFGALSPNDGGRTQRTSLSGEWAWLGRDSATRSNFYVVDYGLNLFSAPSGYIKGNQGDQHEQEDVRTTWGGELRHSWFMGPAWRDSELVAGGQFRQDDIHRFGLYDTANRLRTNTVRVDRARETGLGFFAEIRTQWTPWFRSQLGFRHDHLAATVTAKAGEYNLANGGRVAAGQTSPKLGVAFGPFEQLGATEIFSNWGSGFHSNDARGATARLNPLDGTAVDAVPLLVKARTAEVGVRAQPLSGWTSTLALWQMNLASELVFIGDEGTTEPKGASRRHGVEWSNRVALARNWHLDASIAQSTARFVAPNPDNGGRHVPNAIPLTASVGLSMDTGGAWFGTLNMRYLGAYALEETAQQKSTPFLLANLKVGYRVGRHWQWTLDALNLTNRRANDIEYRGAACTLRESQTGVCGSSGIDGRLLHPLEPRTLRLGLRINF